MSHPVRVRGLKPLLLHHPRKPAGSHPVRVRGLKPAVADNNAISGVSHPVRVRGLKLPKIQGILQLSHVAPRAGAWIETC